MGWLYIVIRTFPFWALPLGLAFCTAWFASRKAKRKLRFYWPIMGLILIGTSIFFLLQQGHFKAVPTIHELITGQSMPR